MSRAAPDLIRRLAGRAADLVWPRVCAVEGCGRVSDRPGRHICSSCFASLPFHEAGGACRTCGALIAAKTSHEFTCEECRAHPPKYEFARSALTYAEPADQMLMDFKFRRATWLCEDFTDLLEGLVRAKLPFHEIDVVAPVPLHPARERERGYNQSALLARALARRINRRADCSSLVRTRNTQHQARLDEASRRTNLRDAFDVPDARYVRGRVVLLIDDIMTTGSTLDQCARPLLATGAARVWCATVARAVLRGPAA